MLHRNIKVLDKTVVFQLDAVNIVLITSRNTVFIRLHVEDVGILVPVLLAVARNDDSLLASTHPVASVIKTSTDLDIRLTLMLP